MPSVGTYEGQQHGVGYQPDQGNWFCCYCYQFTTSKAGEPDPRRCSTPGCERPTGFGKFEGRRV
jgi:hypothetical protein